MAANGISTLATKQARQEAKLALAEQDRAARNVVEPGRYANTTADITQLPNPYNGNIGYKDSSGRTALYDEFNGTGGEIQSVTITTPIARRDGSGWNPAITTVRFQVFTPTDDLNPDPNLYTYQPLRATGTLVFDGNNHVSGINITYGGAGYKKHTGPGYRTGQVIVDIFIIQDNSTGDPETDEIGNTTDTNIDVTATDISYVGLTPGRPWA
jgi:hypothetical protein